MAQRSFKLSDELDARLVAEAARQGRSVSNLIVRVLDEVGNQHSDPGPSSKRVAQYDAVLKEIPDTAALKRKLDANPGPLLSPLPEGTPLPKIAPRRQPR